MCGSVCARGHPGVSVDWGRLVNHNVRMVHGSVADDGQPSATYNSIAHRPNPNDAKTDCVVTHVSGSE